MNEQKQIRKMSVRDRLMSIICNDEIVDYLIKNSLVIPEDAVVLTREKYDEFLRQNFMIDMLKDCIKDARKEATDKIMNDISNDIIVINTKEYGNIEVVPVERLQEIIKTLEVNE